MKYAISLFTSILLLFCFFSLTAQTDNSGNKPTVKHKYRKFYIGSSFEGAMLSVDDVNHNFPTPQITSVVWIYGIKYIAGLASNSYAV